MVLRLQAIQGQPRLGSVMQTALSEVLDASCSCLRCLFQVLHKTWWRTASNLLLHHVITVCLERRNGRP